jgi:hypothetical protein
VLQERWVATAQSLSKWGILLDVSQQQHMPELALEAAAIKCDWDALRRLRVNPSNVAALENGLLNTKLTDVMLCVVENRFGDVEKLCAQSVQLALSNWQLAPPMCAGSNLHKASLNAFHRVVELRESNGIMIEAIRASKEKDKNIPDIKTVLKSWRLRLCETPFFTQSIDSLMEWRLYIFNAVKNIYQNTPGRDQTQSSTLVDTTWTLLSNARYYRKQRLPEVSLLSFHRLRAITSMEVSDIFTKIREQVLLSFSPVPAHMLAGLHLINTTNLDFFTSFQKAELFRLKALLLYHLDKVPEANEMFAHSVQVHRMHDRAWLNWSNFCYDNIAQNHPATMITNQPKIYSAIDVSQAARTIACTLRSVDCNSGPAKHLLQRALWLVMYADNDAHNLAETLYNHGNHLPPAVWIPVIRLLVQAACQICAADQQVPVRTDRLLVPIIVKVGIQYPNAVVYELLSKINQSSSPSSASSLLCGQILRQIKTAAACPNFVVADLAQNLHDSIRRSVNVSTVTEHCHRVMVDIWSEIISSLDIKLSSPISAGHKQALQKLFEFVSSQLSSNDKGAMARLHDAVGVLNRYHSAINELMNASDATAAVVRVSSRFRFAFN